MGNKLTYEQVKEVFEIRGNTLLSTVYVNSHTPLEYICDCGEKDIKKLHNFKKGRRCKKCGIEKYSSAQKLTYQEVKETFESKGCVLLSKEYINCDTSLEYICNCGRNDKKTIRCFKKGQRCKECKKKKISEAKKLSYKEVKEIFESKGNDCFQLNILIAISY